VKPRTKEKSKESVMAGRVLMVSGSKSGVGKSIVSMALTHYLLKQKDEVLLIEADTANPDVGKPMGKASKRSI
jgi:Mrp family chromosome partitioning ATPase